MSLRVCQTISMAMTIVFPVPVAILIAQRTMPSFISLERRATRFFAYRRPGLVSVSQMTVSTALQLGEERSDVAVLPGPIGEQPPRPVGGALPSAVSSIRVDGRGIFLDRFVEVLRVESSRTAWTGSPLWGVGTGRIPCDGRRPALGGCPSMARPWASSSQWRRGSS